MPWLPPAPPVQRSESFITHNPHSYIQGVWYYPSECKVQVYEETENLSFSSIVSVSLEKHLDILLNPTEKVKTMPSLKKTLHFIGSALSCAGGVALLGYGMSADWSTSTIRCVSSNETGTGELTVGLFKGTLMLRNCPFFDSSQSIEGKQLLRV